MYKVFVLMLPAVIFLNSCISQEPSEIELHSEECVYCIMVISDERFPAQLVSDKGKSYNFDSIECMAAFEYQNPEIADGAKFYLTDYTQPDDWQNLEEVTIYRSDEVQSPMGLSLFAIAEGSSVPQPLGTPKPMSWQQTVDYVVTSWEMRK